MSHPQLMSHLFTGLHRRWSPCQYGTSNRLSLMKTAEIELKQIADEIGAERESCQRVDDALIIYEMLSPTTVVQTRPLIQCQLQDFKDSSFS